MSRLIFQGRLYRSASYLPAMAIVGERPIILETRLSAQKRAVKIGWETSGLIVESE